jgi:hypothetical protein
LIPLPYWTNYAPIATDGKLQKREVGTSGKNFSKTMPSY